jgi:hypothetical protein
MTQFPALTGGSSKSSRTDKRDPLLAQGDSLSLFFRFHGFWAPGVRAFRRMMFPAKAAWISGAFLVPLILLGWGQVRGRGARAPGA